MLDFAIFGASQMDGKLGELVPMYGRNGLMFERLVGSFFLLCAIARSHGAMHLGEKGAYR